LEKSANKQLEEQLGEQLEEEQQLKNHFHINDQQQKIMF
jgi:hypothetical protein